MTETDSGEEKKNYPQVSMPVEGNVGDTRRNLSPLAAALLNFIQSTEADLDVETNQLRQDMTGLPLDAADRLTQIADLTVRAAYLAGRRDTLADVAGVVVGTEGLSQPLAAPVASPGAA